MILLMSRSEIIGVPESDIIVAVLHFGCLAVRYVVCRSGRFGVSESDLACLAVRYLVSQSLIFCVS